MPGLWVIIAALVAGVLVMLLVPLARKRPPLPPREEYDVAVYKDQLGEVDRDLDRGLLTDEQAAAARTEIQRRLLAAAAAAEASDPASTAGGIGGVAVSLGLLLPLGALSFYLFLGTPDYPNRPIAERGHEIAAAKQRQGLPDVEAMVRSLEEKLKNKPDDLEGWHLLARSYRSMERFADAAAAFRRVVALSNRRLDVLLDYGEVLIMARGGEVPPAARAIIEEVVAAGHPDPRALFFLGIAKAQDDDLAGAMESWVELAGSAPPDAPWLAEVKKRLRLAAEDMGVEPPAVALDAPSPDPAPAGPGPSQAEVEKAQGMSGVERDAMIRSMVQRLADRLEENPDDADGWMRLARAYQVLGETEKADEALKRAREQRKK